MGRICSTYWTQQRCIQGFIGETLRGRGKLEDPGVDGIIISRRIFGRWVVEAWAGSIWLRIGADGRRL
jgi:hypothetical protein